jgi:ABC-type branched-subunit amino acid transport system ATPase component
MIELDVNNISKSFGGLQALDSVTFKVRGPELIGLIGPNGAGKTTLTNVLDASRPGTYLSGDARLSSHDGVGKFAGTSYGVARHRQS